MDLPASLAIPAGLLGASAYLNARLNFSDDVHFGSAAAGGWLTSTWQGYRDRLNLFYVLESHATSRATASKAFLVFEGKTWTYRETYEITLQYGTWLREQYAIKPREVVAMDFMNSPEFVFLWMGLWSIGACPACINYNLTAEPLKHCIDVSTARVIFVEDCLQDKFTTEVKDWASSPSNDESRKPVEIVFLNSSIQTQIASMSPQRPPDNLRIGIVGYDMAMLIYTSGTTGMPKPAILPWGKIVMGAKTVGGWLPMKTSDVFYTCMPLYHTSAAIFGLVNVLTKGSTFVIGRKFSNRTFWHDVRAQKATIIQYVGETCRYLLTAPPQIDPATGENLDTKHQVRIAFGNGLRPDIWNAFKERFGIDTIAEFYGATEGSLAIFNLSKNDFSSGSVGRAGRVLHWLLGPKVRVIRMDPETQQPLRSGKEDFCSLAEFDEPGELVYKLDAKNPTKDFVGYYGNEKATSGKIMHDVFVKGDAYFRTGDTMRLDSEGRFWFCDRIGDTFRWKSENVSTAEVQIALGTYKSVLEANVYGVELPNHDGRAGCAAILLDGEPNVKLLRDFATHVSKNLPKYAVPAFLRVVKESQITGNNKQQKHELRAEGVDPAKVTKGDQIFWLDKGTYVSFRHRDWNDLQTARIKL